MARISEHLCVLDLLVNLVVFYRTDIKKCLPKNIINKLQATDDWCSQYKTDQLNLLYEELLLCKLRILDFS